MRLARVSGTVTATVKQAALTGAALLLVDIVDGAGTVITPGVVAVDTVGAGVGDNVLLAEGSAARLPSATAGLPIDAAIVAIVDQVALAQKTSTSSKRRKS